MSRHRSEVAFRDVLEFAYYFGWRRNEILYLTWSEVDLATGVVRLHPDARKRRHRGCCRCQSRSAKCWLEVESVARWATIASSTAMA